jgi:hypothetical protein
MNRRGFFSRMFGSRRIPDVIFFGVQVIVSTYVDDELHKKLYNVISEPPDDEESPAQKHSFYKRVSSVLQECLPGVEYGYWDYLTKTRDAESEFHSWVGEIEASMATEEEEMGDEINDGTRLSGEKNYVAVSMVFLLEGDTLLEDFVSIIDSIGEDQYFDRDSFRKLLDAVNYIDFEYSFGDACFIMPGNEQDGLSFEDIHGEGWEYLKPVM